MLKLNRENFKGIKLDKLNKYIKLINEKLKGYVQGAKHHVTIHESPSWQGSVSNLMKFLNENNYIQHEGLRINDKSISNFISRLTRKITPKTFNEQNIDNNLNFFPLLNMSRRTKVTRVAQPGDLNTWQTQYPAMYELGDVVLNKKKDFHLVRNAVNLKGAQEWAAKHKYPVPQSDVDINNDNIPDTVVYDNYGKPVMVNGWTLQKSQYPLRKQFLDENPTKDKRHAAGGFSGFSHEFKGRHDQNGNYVYTNFVNAWNAAGYKLSGSAYHIFGRLVTDYVKQYVRTLLSDTPVAQDEKLFKAINSCVPYTTIIACHWVQLLSILWNHPVPEIVGEVNKIRQKTNDPFERYKKFKSKMSTKKYENGFIQWVKQNYSINLNPSDVAVELSKFGINKDSLVTLATNTFRQNRTQDGKISADVVNQIKKQISAAASSAKDELISACFAEGSRPVTPTNFSSTVPVNHPDYGTNQEYPALPEDENDEF